MSYFLGKLEDEIAMNGVNKVMNRNNNTLYLIVVKPVWDRIVSGNKVIEYRERTDYWDKRIGNREYKYLRITNGYGNLTRPYRLYRYTGATRVMKDNQQCYAISIAEDLIVESRDSIVKPDDICHYSGLPSTSSFK